jgi:hypothetical protein
MVQDADPKFVSTSLAAHFLERSDVIGDPLADMVFAICDTFLERDMRLAALWGQPSGG